MITEDYVSFEVAKLLKEKGFDVYGDGSFGSEIKIWMEYSPFGKIRDVSSSRPSIKGYTAPTHQMAMKWLRKKYNIYISIQPDFPSDKDYKMCWCWSANILFENCISTTGYQCYIETYEEATEAALKYCLENLI